MSWVLFKENVKPLKRGRDINLLNNALQSQTDNSLKKSLSDTRRKLIEVIDEYNGEHPLKPWIEENYGCDVVCFIADVGQGVMEMEGLERKAKASGASQLVVKDLKEEFVRDYIFPCLRAGAVYERKYLLGTSMARPVITKAMVDVAKEVGADAVAYGCTGKGNDQWIHGVCCASRRPVCILPYHHQIHCCQHIQRCVDMHETRLVVIEDYIS